MGCEGTLATQQKQKQLEPHQTDGGMDPGLWDALPDEIVDRILAFLPLPCFFRLQVVCKRWNSLRFSRGFLDVYSEVVTPRPWLLVFAKGRKRPDVPHIPNLRKLGLAYNFLLKRVSFLYNDQSKKWYNLALPCLPPQASILAASGGLLCCEGGMGYFLVCNPVTNTWRPLPPSLLDRHTIQFEMVTEQSTRSYMVIAVGGSFLCPPGKETSDDYRVRLVLNRLRTSAFGGSCSGLGSLAGHPRGYPGFPTAHEHPVTLQSSGCGIFGASRVSAMSSNCEEFHAGVGPNQLRVLRSAPASRLSLGDTSAVMGDHQGPSGGSAGHDRDQGGKPCTAHSEVPTLLMATCEHERSAQATVAPSSRSSPSSGVARYDSHSYIIAALDRLQISTPREPIAKVRASDLPTPVSLCEGSLRTAVGTISSSEVAIRELGTSATIAQRSQCSEVSATTGRSGGEQVYHSMPVTYNCPEENSSGVSHGESEQAPTLENHPVGMLVSGNPASSSLLLPLPISPSSCRWSSSDERIGLASLSTIAQPAVPTCWRLGDNDGIASILDHANLRLSRDSEYHLGQAFNSVRENLLRPTEARHSDNRLGSMLNRIRSNAIVPGIARSRSSEHYGFTVEVYDSKIGRWERAGLLPKEVDSISRTSYCNGFLYCLAFNLVQIFRFDMVQRSWTSIEMPGPFFFIVPDLVELNGRLLLVGAVKEVSLTHFIITWELDQTKMEWKEIVRMPDELCKAFHQGEHFQVFSCVGNGSLLFFMSENVPRILVFDFDKKSWDWSPTCHGIESRFQRGFKGFCFQPRLDALV